MMDARSNPGPAPGADEARERLLSRLVDGEATAAERARFEALADDAPELREELARRTAQATALAEGLDAALARAARHPLPSERARPAARLPWLLAGLGWAAALLLGLAWLMRPAPAPAWEAVPAESSAPLTWDDHLRIYESAPNVLDELEPTVLEVEQRDDGMLVVRYLRRIEEFAVIEPGDELPAAGSALPVDPAALRDTVRGEPGSQ